MDTDNSIPLPKQVKNLKGQRFGRLLVIEFAGVIKQGGYWLCQCDCGNIKQVRCAHLTGNKIVSCGCHKLEQTLKRNTTHRKSRTPEYVVWVGMHTRCYNPHNKAFPDYGGRGITICDRWLHSFESFLEDMGPRPSSEHSIDRIDNDGNYEPDNCRWAVPKTQANNKRNNRVVRFNGEAMTISQWASRLGIRHRTLFMRLVVYHWPTKRALTEPVN